MSAAFRYAQLLHLDYYRMVSQVPSSESHDTIGLCVVVVVVVDIVVVVVRVVVVIAPSIIKSSFVIVVSLSRGSLNLPV